MKKHAEMIAAISSGILTLIAWYGETWFPTLSIALFLSAYFIGGYVKAKEGLQTLWHEKELDVNLLMIFAAIGAASIGYWMEGALLIFIFSLSGALESYTLAKSERDLSTLMAHQPDQARLRLDNGEEKWIPSDKLQVGHQVIVKPGEKIPADATIIQGNSAIKEAMITGESVPVDKAEGDEVFAGTMNGNGLLILEVIKPNKETLLAKIMQRLAEAREEVPASQHKMDRLEKVYAKVILLATLALIILPPIFLTWTWTESTYHAMIFLVVASPCALVASIMPALLSAISNGARKGLLFKNGIQVEKMADVQVVAFDKTGTLTQGKLRITDVIAIDLSKQKLLQIAGSVEQGSEHPIACAIVEHVKKENIPLQPLTQLQAQVGTGVEAQINGETWKIGKPALFSALSSEVKRIINQLQQQGKTIVLVGLKEKVKGVIALQDQIREDAKQTIAHLKKRGIVTVMLTGDQPFTAAAIATQIEVDEFYSQLLPEEKVEKVAELREKYGKVIMIGDGMNDAPALAKAQVGIAMGRGGSDVTLETADVVLMNNNLSAIPFAIQLSQKMQMVIKQNIIFALSMIGIMIVANLAQSMTLPIGVIGHEGSTLVVILNGLRLLR